MKGTPKWLACVVVVTMVLGLLAGCAQTPAPAATTAPSAAPSASTEPAAPTAQPTVEISVCLWDIANSFPEGKAPDAIAKMVQDKFNIKITPINVGWDNADDKYNTWAASGQLPDVCGALAMPGTARYFQWISDGVIRALPSDLSKYANISKYMAQPEVQAFAVDGKNYLFPRQTYADSSWWSMDRGLYARKDWMEKLGYTTEPTDEQGWIDMCVKMAKENPDGNKSAVGFTTSAASILFSQIFPGYGYTDTKWAKQSDGTYQLGIATDTAFKLAQFYRKLFQAGGMDPDFATIDASKALDNFVAGKVGVLARQVSPALFRDVGIAWKKLNPDKDFLSSVVILHGPLVVQNYVRFAEMGYWSETYISAKVDDAKMDRIAQLYDWLYSDEGMDTMIYGIEGTDWKMDNGEITLQTPIDPATGDHVTTVSLYPFTSSMSSLACWDMTQYVNPSIPKEIRDLTTKERDFRSQNWDVPKVNWQVAAINVPEKQAMASVKFNDDWVKFIMDTSSTSDADLYTAMKANWDANGYKAAVDAINKKAKELGIN